MVASVVYPTDGSGGVAVAPVDPDALVDYEIDWVLWLNGDTISTSAWTVENATEASSSNTTTAAKIFIQNALAGKIVKMTNRITTAGGRTDDRTLLAAVRNR